MRVSPFQRKKGAFVKSDATLFQDGRCGKSLCGEQFREEKAEFDRPQDTAYTQGKFAGFQLLCDADV